MKKIGWVVGTIFVLFVGVLAVGYMTDGGVQAEAGDCAGISGSADKPTYKSLDCGSAQANVKIACGDNRAVSFPEPAVTFCLAKGDA